LKPNVDSKENIVKHDFSKLADNEVYTEKYFFTNLKYNVRDDLINWDCSQVSTTIFTLIIKIFHHGGRRAPKLVLGY